MKIPDFIGPFLSRNPKMLQIAMRTYARLNGCKISSNASKLKVSKGPNSILIAKDLAPYLRDVIDHFVMYFNACEADLEGDSEFIRDYSDTRWHRLRGWEHFDVQVPGLPEPMTTVTQYLELLSLKPGETVLDLGAYAGITALCFQEAVGASGRVVSVEADPSSFDCVETNFDLYAKLRGYAPVAVNAAIWSSCTPVMFVAEASLGSAVEEVLPRANTRALEVAGITLSKLVEFSDLVSVDAIKADIEGAEYQAFTDTEFFERFHPRIIFEPADTAIESTKAESLIELLSTYGYSFSWHKQVGSRLPLILCE